MEEFRKLQSMVKLFALVIVLVTGIGIACSASQKQVAREAVRIADAACVVVPVMVDSDVLEEICATEQDLAPLITEILKQRRKAAAGADAGAPPPVCVPMPPPDAFKPAPKKE